MIEACPDLITEEASAETLLPLLPSTYQQCHKFLNYINYYAISISDNLMHRVCFNVTKWCFLRTAVQIIMVNLKRSVLKIAKS